MKGKISTLILCVVFFFIGSIWGKFNFITSNIYQSIESIEVVAANGDKGVIPSGTELHFHSTAHSQTKYFLFIEVPLDESQSKIKAVEFDSYGGIKVLNSAFK
jgi:hypothetical protein